MNAGALGDELGAVLERVQAESDRQITAAKKAVADLNFEKAKAQAAIAQLANEHKQAQAELDAVLKHLGRGSSLAGLDSDIAKAKAELKKLNTEKAALEVSVAALTKQRADGEAQVIALRNEANNWATARSQTEAAMANIRRQLA